MGELRVRAMVGEGRSARKGLLRFVLENEGHTVVSEAASTLELAQQLVVHRPDLVVLDDGIDASAVGMIREVLPSARVILVWPKGVSAVGADARLEPSEVMAGLGPAVERAMGSGPLIRPSRPRVPVPDVIVVPEAEPFPPAGPSTAPSSQEQAGAATAVERAALATAPAAVESVADEPIIVVPEALSGVMLEPSTEAPSWVFTATDQAAPEVERRRRGWLGVALVLLGVVLGAALGAVILADRTVSIQGIVGSVGDLVLPSPDGGGETGGTTDQPGTYEGQVQVQADGTIRVSSEGDLRMRVDGFVNLVADGVVKVNGEGVVQTVSNEHVRIHGNGTVRLTITGGHLRMRLQGSLVARGVGTVRIDGIGRFLIRHRPV
jgi:hypothetical protein